MDKKKREIRFFIDIEIYERLKRRAEELDIPLASFIKANINKWGKNGERRKKS